MEKSFGNFIANFALIYIYTRFRALKSNKNYALEWDDTEAMNDEPTETQNISWGQIPTKSYGWSESTQTFSQANIPPSAEG